MTWVQSPLRVKETEKDIRIGAQVEGKDMPEKSGKFQNCS